MRIGMPFPQDLFLTNLRRINRDLEDALGRLASGRRVIDPSDDPQASAELMKLEDDARVLSMRQRGIDHARTHLELTESALSDLGAVLQAALVKATQGASEQYDSLQRIAIADEVAALRAEVLDIAALQVSGRYIFSGTRTDAPPYDVSGQYQGNGGLIEIPLDDARVAINMPGNIVFGEVGGGGALDALARIESALRADAPDAVAGLIDEVETQISLNSARLATIGARRNRVENADLRIADRQLEISRRMNELGAADLAAAISDVQRLETGYQAALQAGARLFGPTFFDFLG